MGKKYYFAVFYIVLVVSISSICKSEYILQPAFPNLGNFSNPVELVNSYDGTNRLFLAQQNGKIYVFNNNPLVSSKKIFIDLSGKVSPYHEAGLCGLTFHPDYENNHYFYTHYVFDSTGSSSGRWLRVSRFSASSANPDTAYINSEVILLSTPLVGGGFHNGGKIDFLPDGYLYISFGDGPYSPFLPSPAQDKESLLGKMLRINVDSATSGKNYSIPVTNPFYGNTEGYREEIYALGFRNLYKFSFDELTNHLYGADVGQAAFEEINLIENGNNYGWNKMEGFHCFPSANACDTAGYGFTRPIYEYIHFIGHHAIVGGYVYRGGLHPELYGKYIYGDYSIGRIWALTHDGVNPTTSIQLLDTNYFLSTFGVDENNELYVCSYSENTGKIFKLLLNSTVRLNLKTMPEGFYNTSTLKLNMRDTVRAYLRNVTSPFALIDSSKAIIDSVLFSGSFNFINAPSGNYYIQLIHRNALETWSRSGGQAFTKGETYSYDFTTDSAKAFGNNMKKVGNYWTLYEGDVLKDGFIDQRDVLLIYNDALNIITGYVSTDVNGNSIVDLNDMLIAYNNSIRFVQMKIPSIP